LIARFWAEATAAKARAATTANFIVDVCVCVKEG